MFNFFNRGGNPEQIKEYLEKGAKVIDVRTPGEFYQGNIPGSELIEISQFPQNIEKLKSFNTPLILVCLTGARASQGVRYLGQYGIDAINGGYWQDVMQLQTS